MRAVNLTMQADDMKRCLAMLGVLLGLVVVGLGADWPPMARVESGRPLAGDRSSENLG